MDLVYRFQIRQTACLNAAEQSRGTLHITVTSLANEKSRQREFMMFVLRQNRRRLAIVVSGPKSTYLLTKQSLLKILTTRFQR